MMEGGGGGGGGPPPFPGEGGRGGWVVGGGGGGGRWWHRPLYQDSENEGRQSGERERESEHACVCAVDMDVCYTSTTHTLARMLVSRPAKWKLPSPAQHRSSGQCSHSSFPPSRYCISLHSRIYWGYLYTCYLQRLTFQYLLGLFSRSVWFIPE